jgi:predicted DNA-binding transcriptional regulator AlpA
MRETLEAILGSAAPLPPAAPDYIVLSDKQVAEIAGFGIRTLERLREKGEAPPRVRLSTRRYGTRLGDLREWLRSRVLA